MPNAEIAGTKAKILTINQKDEAARRQSASSLAEFTKKVRNSGLNTTRIIQAVHDPDSRDIYNIPVGSESNYALVEIFGKKDSDPRMFKLEVKKAQGVLIANKISVVANKEYYNRDYPVCKFICKIV